MTLPILLLLSHTEAFKQAYDCTPSMASQMQNTKEDCLKPEHLQLCKTDPGYMCQVCNAYYEKLCLRSETTTSGHPTTKAPTTMTKAPTTDCDPHWKDHEGDDCLNYGDDGEKWCTKDGKEGQNWQPKWGTLSQQVTNKKTPLACPQCGCGGGHSIHHEVEEDRSPRPSTGGDKWLQPLSGDPNEDPKPLADPKDELKNVAKQCGWLGGLNPGQSFKPSDPCLKNRAPATCGDCRKQPRDSRWAYAFLDELNIHRCMHNAPPVQYNKKLECWASKVVTDRRSKDWHHSCSGRADTNVQENLSLSKEGTARGATRSWYREIKECFPAPSYRYNPAAFVCGHFVNLIWKSITHIGCHNQDGASACLYAAGEGEEKYNGHESGWAGTVLTDDLAEPKPTKERGQCDNAQWKTVKYSKTYTPRADMDEADVPGNYGSPEDTSKVVVAQNTCELLKKAFPDPKVNPCGWMSDE